MSKNTSVFTTESLLLASSKERSGMLLNILAAPTTMNCPVQNVKSVKVEKPQSSVLFPSPQAMNSSPKQHRQSAPRV